MSDPLGIKAYLAMAKLVGLLILISIVCYQSSQIHKWHTQADKQAAARIADRLLYEAAQKQAEAQNLAHIAQIEKQQDAINEKARSDYRRDLDRLRSQPRTDQGASGGSKAPPDGKAPGGAGSTDPLRLPPEKLLRVQEIELQLQYLIDWVNRQSQIDPNH